MASLRIPLLAKLAVVPSRINTDRCSVSSILYAWANNRAILNGNRETLQRLALDQKAIVPPVISSPQLADRYRDILTIVHLYQYATAHLAIIDDKVNHFIVATRSHSLVAKNRDDLP